MNRYNKGEWAELYTLAQLLGKGRVENDLGDRRSLTVISALSRESRTESLHYKISENGIILNDAPLAVGQKDLLRHCVGLLADIGKVRPAAAGAFESEAGEALAAALKIKSIKAESKSKSDIRISIIDPFTGDERHSGYSIKLIGGNDTSIINASAHTRFTYSVCGLDKSTLMKSPALMERGKPAKIIPLLHAAGGWLELVEITSIPYAENLCFVDTAMPVLLAEILYQSYDCGRGRGMKKMSEEMRHRKSPSEAARNFSFHNPTGPLGRFASDERKQQWLVHKLKDFLIAHATSMNPSTPWNGDIGVTGGILIVDTTTGEITNNPIHDLNGLKQHLFDNCAFDSPSTTKFNYGHIYQHEVTGSNRIDLVLAVRGQ